MKTLGKYLVGWGTFVLLTADIFWGIAITLSYFPWSPFGYEQCGMQVIAWFLIYPILLGCLIVRAILKYRCRLHWSYLLMPILIGILWIPVIGDSCDEFWAIVVCMLEFLTILLTLWIDGWCWKLWGENKNAETGDD